MVIILIIQFSKAFHLSLMMVTLSERMVISGNAWLTKYSSITIQSKKQELRNEEIRKLRGRYKFSQKAFSDLLGVTENYVYLLEKGVKTPSKTLKLSLDCVKRELREKKGLKRKGL